MRLRPEEADTDSTTQIIYSMSLPFSLPTTYHQDQLYNTIFASDKETNVCHPTWTLSFPPSHFYLRFEQLLCYFFFFLFPASNTETRRQ